MQFSLYFSFFLPFIILRTTRSSHLPFLDLLWNKNLKVNAIHQASYTALKELLVYTQWDCKLDEAKQILLDKPIDPEFVLYFENWLVRSVVIHSRPLLNNYVLGYGSLGDSPINSFVNLRTSLEEKIVWLLEASSDPVYVVNIQMLFMQELFDALSIIFCHGDPNPEERSLVLNNFYSFLELSDLTYSRVKFYFMMKNSQGARKKFIISEPFQLQVCRNGNMNILYLKNTISYLQLMQQDSYLDFVYIELLMFYARRANSTQREKT